MQSIRDLYFLTVIGMMMLLSFILFMLIPSPSYAIKNNTGFEFVDMVYTINLPQSVERKQHILSEFKLLGIKKYKIFTATDQNSEAVYKLMKSNFVKKYPPCFRCQKKFCKCNNNCLIKPQIGNWISFIRLFEDIIKNDYKYVLITEDDVKFTKDARYIMSRLINQQTFIDHGIDPNKPILISLFDNIDNINNQSLSAISLRQEIGISNPCFIVNKKFALSFLKNLKQIDTTSDVYIHIKLLDMDPTIQHFSAYPKPAYELSDGKNAVFSSTIHPKGINEQDKIRKKKHKKRIEYWEYLLDKLPFMKKYSLLSN